MPSTKFRNPPRPIIGFFKDPSTWDATVFETLIRDELENTYGTICTSDETVIASMIVVMESLMEAQRHINEEGYITQYAAGVGTTGWVKLRNECIDKIIKMLGELGLVARGRPKKVNKATAVDELFATA
jgi:hypothetical protein